MVINNDNNNNNFNRPNHYHFCVLFQNSVDV